MRQRPIHYSSGDGGFYQGGIKGLLRNHILNLFWKKKKKKSAAAEELDLGKERKTDSVLMKYVSRNNHLLQRGKYRRSRFTGSRSSD